MLSHIYAGMRQDPFVFVFQTLTFLIMYTNSINTSKGATFDTLAALLLSLVISIPELPGPEVWNVKNALLSGRTVVSFAMVGLIKRSSSKD